MSGAGFETTASVLHLVIFHALEQLPYLTAILMEGLRLSPAIAIRMARISLGTDLSYKQWKIPAGTHIGTTLILMHLDDSFYPDPHFLISRDGWTQKSGGKEKTFAPFSRGTSVYLGIHLA
ncbi:cytochrome P450 [Xylariaceae sp. FL1651]|nr:cytochrome P450 [Xylariaceae sp. FL1651]